MYLILLTKQRDNPPLVVLFLRFVLWHISSRELHKQMKYNIAAVLHTCNLLAKASSAAICASSSSGGLRVSPMSSPSSTPNRSALFHISVGRLFSFFFFIITHQCKAHTYGPGIVFQIGICIIYAARPML